MSVIAFIAAALAFLSFGLSTGEHHQRRFGHRPSPLAKRRLRMTAWLLLAVSFVFAIAARGWIFGPVVWSGEVMLGAGVAFLGLNLTGKAAVKPR